MPDQGGPVPGLQDRAVDTRTCCGFITRDPDTNLITIINNRYVNVANAFVSGVDLDVLWNTDVDFLDMAESLDLRLLAGWQNGNSQTPFRASNNERAGTMDYPDVRALATLGFTAGPYRISLMGRYRPETILNMGWQTQPMATCGAASCVNDNTIESQFVTNLTFQYQQQLPSGATWDTSLTVSNLFDTYPPVVPSSIFGGGVAQSTAPDNFEIYRRQFQLRFGYSL